MESSELVSPPDRGNDPDSQLALAEESESGCDCTHTTGDISPEKGWIMRRILDSILDRTFHGLPRCFT